MAASRPGLIELRYPLPALLPDYARGAVGAVLSGGAWALAPAAPATIAIFGGLTGPFVIFTMRNVWRQRTRVTLSEDAIKDKEMLEDLIVSVPSRTSSLPISVVKMTMNMVVVTICVQSHQLNRKKGANSDRFVVCGVEVQCEREGNGTAQT